MKKTHRRVLSEIGTSLLCIAMGVFQGCATVEDARLSDEERIRLMELEQKQEMLKSVREKLNAIHSMIESGKLNDAEAYLLTVSSINYSDLGMPFYDEEIANITKALEKARSLQNYASGNSITEKSMLNETNSKLALPDTYGKTVIIDYKLPEVEMEKGPMEELINKKVSINLDNAGIAELVGALRESCKLNVMADDALAEAKTLTIAVEDVPLKEVLQYISRNMGVAFHLGQNVVWITQSEEQNNGPILETRIIRLHHGIIPTIASGGPGAPGSELGGVGDVEAVEDTELDDALTTLLSDSPDGATHKIYKDRNILVIKDTIDNIRLAEKIVQEFDKPPFQVCIEARFVTVSQDDLKDLGAEITQKTPIAHHGEVYTKNNDNVISLTNTYDSLLRNEALRAVNALTSLGALDAGSENGVGLINFSGVLNNRTYDIIVSALEKKISTVTLSVPKVTVMNNRQARIRKGSNLYYFEEYDVGVLDRGDEKGTENMVVPTGTPTKLPVGLTFDVRPNIGNDGKTIMLGLKPEIVEFEAWESYLSAVDGNDNDDDDDDTQIGTIKLPRTHEQSVVTTVSISSGQTVVLGGLLENKKSKSVKKIPLLGDLPLIGFLFRHEEKTSTPINLLIFVTATVINDKGEFVQIAEPELQ